MTILQSASGFVLILALAWLFSEKRRGFPWRLAAVGLVLQFAFAWILIEAAWARGLFLWLNRAVGALQEATGAGTRVVFGYLGGGALPYAETAAGASFILAFQALPLVLVISALSALLWHWRILPWVVAGFAWVLRRSFRIGGGLGLGTAANIFVGMVEAPLLIRPVMARLPRSDLFVLMTCGMATVAGTVMVLYATILSRVLDDPIGHILTASVISVPAAIVVARIMVPPEAAPDATPQGAETEPQDESLAALTRSPHAGAMDAIVKGTQDGLALLLNIVAMLIVLVALVALMNAVLSLLPDWGGAPVTLRAYAGSCLTSLCLGTWRALGRDGAGRRPDRQQDDPQ